MCALVVLGLVFSMPSQEIGLGEHLWNYLLCVERDVKWQLSQSVSCLVFGCFRAQKRNTWPQRHWSWSPGGSTRNFWCGSSDTRSRPSSRKTLNRHDTICVVVGVGQSKKTVGSFIAVSQKRQRRQFPPGPMVWTRPLWGLFSPSVQHTTRSKQVFTKWRC